jgi:MFS family permease
MSNASANGIAPNAMRLLWAGFLAILAAGIGFGVRGGILANWGADFGFTGAQLGAIGGAGFTGFCFGIIIGGVVVDKIGYGKLVFAAFLFHVLSAFITFAATAGQAQETAYMFLYWGTFVFALANGTLEAVANPLVATLFPKNRTHYLNILHASWPAGLVIGGLIGWTLGEGGTSWKIQLGLFLIPTVLYGIAFMGQKFPKSEAAAKGLTLGEMLDEVGVLGGLVATFLLTLFFKTALNLTNDTSYVIGAILLVTVGLISRKQGILTTERLGVLIAATLISMFIGLALKLDGSASLTLALALLVGLAVTIGSSWGSWLLFVLFITHALVGAVELGTDGWIQNITGNILTPAQGKILFVFTSLLMFALRFCAHFIEKNLKISPVGLLLICSIFGVVGLLMTSGITTFMGAMVALTVYAIGKTFFWPTMLAVVGDRFPRTGAIAMSVMGGIGMMSAGLLGGPGLGYAKDRFTAEHLATANPAVYDQYKASSSSKFLIFDEVVGLDGTKLGQAQAADPKSVEQQLVVDSSIIGDRQTLKADAVIPAVMALIYLLLLLYFKSIGGYKPVAIETERVTGGVQGPMEA